MKKAWVVPQEVKPPEKGQETKNLFTSGLRPVVFIGRCFGLIATTSLLQKPGISPRKLNIASIFCALLALFFFSYAVLFIRYSFHGPSSTSPSSISDKLSGITMPSYSLTVCFVYLYLSFATKRLRNLIQDFGTAASQNFPKTFPRFCWLISIVGLSLGIGENIMYDLQMVRKGSTGNIWSLELYYKQVFYNWADFTPYNPVLTVVLIIFVKCGTWGWVYADVIAIVLARAVADKFRMMNEEVRQIIESKPTSTAIKKESVIRWDTVRDEFMILVDITGQVQGFIAPLILSCYCHNIYSITVNLFYWISPSSTTSLEQSFYVDFAFFQFLFRVLSVTYFAAEVHHVSLSILGTIQHCPNSLYTLSLERVEKTLARSPVGICLFNTVMITRAFFISIISFLFTTEIVLLQTTGASSAAIKSGNK